MKNVIKYIVQNVLVKSPLLKADKTAGLKFASLLTMDKEVFNTLNNWAFDDETVKIAIVKQEDWIDFIQAEAAKLLEDE